MGVVNITPPYAGAEAEPRIGDLQQMASGARSSSDVEQRGRGTTVSVDDSETWVEAKRYTVYKASLGFLKELVIVDDYDDDPSPLIYPPTGGGEVG